MKQAAIDSAVTEFNRAAQSMDELAASNNFAEVERHWAAFLVSAGRVFTKLQQGAKASGKSKAWFGRKLHERRTDPLLLYLWHSRNADEHGIQAVTQQHPGIIKSVEPTPAELQEFHCKMQDQPHPYGALAMLEIVNPHVMLVDIIDHGVRYCPPHAHGGSAISNPHPNNVGLLALSYLDSMINEAREYVIEGKN
jgi:hypothetical protein